MHSNGEQLIYFEWIFFVIIFFKHSMRSNNVRELLTIDRNFSTTYSWWYVWWQRFLHIVVEIQCILIIVFRSHGFFIAFKYNIIMVLTTTPTCPEMIGEKQVSTHELGVFLWRRTGRCIGKTGTLLCRKTNILIIIDDWLGDNGNNIIMVPTFLCIFPPFFYAVIQFCLNLEFFKLLNEHSIKSTSGVIDLKFERWSNQRVRIWQLSPKSQENLKMHSLFGKLIT